MKQKTWKGKGSHIRHAKDGAPSQVRPHRQRYAKGSKQEKEIRARAREYQKSVTKELERQIKEAEKVLKHRPDFEGMEELQELMLEMKVQFEDLGGDQILFDWDSDVEFERFFESGVIVDKFDNLHDELQSQVDSAKKTLKKAKKPLPKYVEFDNILDLIQAEEFMDVGIYRDPDEVWKRIKTGK